MPPKEKILERQLWDLGNRCIRELETETGILASSKSEIFGCIFGRDSLITALSLLKVHEKTREAYYLALVRKVLTNLALVQGKEITIESGEEPGKIIHEYRPDGHEHLTKGASPWYLYPDNVMRNYDSVDATPLFLITAHAYLRQSGDRECIEALEPNIRAAIDWIRTYGDANGDGFIDYEWHPDRTCRGPATHSWMDSAESLFFEDRDTSPAYPIAPADVQAYTYVALRAWADYFVGRDTALSSDLAARAARLKKDFNEAFVLEGKRGLVSLAYALDGKGRLLTSPRSSMGHCLFAAWRPESGAMPECIVDMRYVPGVARRLLKPDLYVPRAGIRTLSIHSVRYDPYSHDNGSIWPHDTAIVADGLEQFGFREEAKRVRAGLISAYSHFNTPIELFVYNRGRFSEYKDTRGQGACRMQAWSAGALLASLTEE